VISLTKPLPIEIDGPEDGPLPAGVAEIVADLLVEIADVEDTADTPCRFSPPEGHDL
jgi:hypothetical protein